MADYVTTDGLATVIALNNRSRFEMTLAGLSTYTGAARLVFVLDDGGRAWAWQATGTANGDSIRAAAPGKGGVWVRQTTGSTTGGGLTAQEVSSQVETGLNARLALSRTSIASYAGGAAAIIVDGQVYERDDTATPDGGRVLQANGARYVIADRVVRPEQYGALGRIFETPCTVQANISTYPVPSGHPLKVGHGVMLLSNGQIHRAKVANRTGTSVTLTSPPSWGGSGVLSSDDADAINAAIGAAPNVALDGSYAVGVPVNKCSKPGRRLIGRGYGTEIRGATGGAVVEAVESSYGVMIGLRLTSHPQRPSVGGILFARRQAATTTYCMYYRLSEIYIEMPRIHTANAGFGTYGIYNFAAEIHTYDHVQVDADIPFVGTDENFANISAQHAQVLIGKESMSVIKFSGACTLGASKGAPITLSGMFDFEYSASYLTGFNSVLPQFAPASHDTTDEQRTTKYAVHLRGVTNENIRVTGHIENCTRFMLIESYAMGLDIDVSMLKTEAKDLITVNNADYDIYMSDWRSVRIRNQDGTASNMLKWTSATRGSGRNLNFFVQPNQLLNSARPFTGRVEGRDLHQVQMHPASSVYVNGEYGAHTKGQGGFRVYASGGVQNLPNETWQATYFTGTDYDDLSEITTDGNGTLFTPKRAGTYVFTVRTLVLNSTADNLAQQRLTVNGTPVVSLGHNVIPTAAAQVLQASAEVRLNAGDVVRVQTYSRAYNAAADGSTETFWTGRRV